MTAHKTIRIVAAITALITLFMVGLGGYVRATGAGLACPDWPLCFGKVVPELKIGVFQEVFHRYTALLVSAGIAALAYFGFKSKSQWPAFSSVTKFLLVLLVIQIIFGGLTVLMKLNTFIVTTHLLLGTVLLQTLALIAFEGNKQVEINPKGKGLLVLMSGLVLFQIVLGGFVGTSGAAMACPDIPYCMGEILPANATGQQVVHMLHRGSGVFIFLFSVFLIFKFGSTTSVKRGHMIGMVVFLLFQISLGFSNV